MQPRSYATLKTWPTFAQRGPRSSMRGLSIVEHLKESVKPDSDSLNKLRQEAVSMAKLDCPDVAIDRR